MSTPEVERLDGWLGVMQGFRNEQDVATARQLFQSLAGDQKSYRVSKLCTRVIGRDPRNRGQC